ncbi:MAG: hypothetical protein DHS20C18_25370 [Saprospiraceae bacterium]|nr:MAG: hypothetical protein DHS20C18_25370 [Saprospiraceae bacterium]
MNKILLSAFFAVVMLQLGQAQRLEAWIDAGDKAYEQQDYYSAYRYYGIALEYKENQTGILYNYANAAREFFIFSKADSAYQVVLARDTSNAFPEAAYWLGVVKQRLGDYENSSIFLQRFLDDQPNADASLKAKSLKAIEDNSWALQIVRESDDIIIRNMGENINTPYSDFGTAMKGDTLYYSSFVPHLQDTFNPPRPSIKIFQSIGGQKGMELGKPINTKKRQSAHTAFNSDFSKVYYTRCDYVNAATIRCELYSSTVLPDGKWADTTRLSINTVGKTNTQPNVGMDRDGNEILYFVSDRDGGKGGLDIWFSRIQEDGTLSNPENLEDLNTEVDDATPFYYTRGHALFFSSEGYQTLGGFDIYESRDLGDSWTDPRHLGVPTNSSYNDLYYSIFADGTKAYFSSNRPDSTAIFWDDSKDACCNDIYTYDRDQTVNLLALTFDKLDQTDLLGATVSLYEILPYGEEVLISSLDNPYGNDFNYPLEADKKYKIVATRPGYVQDIAIIDLNDPEFLGKTDIEQRLYLEPGIRLNVTTYDNIDSLPLIGTTVELFEMTPDGEIKIDSKENPTGNDFTFALEPGKKYRIKGMKPGFPDASDVIDLTDPDLADKRVIDKKLYLGQELEVLVFDEDTRLPLNGATVELLEMIQGRAQPKHKRDNPTGNRFYFPLDLSKKYKIKGSRKGYQDANLDLTFDPDQVKEAGGRLTVELYLKRTSLDDFLPLTLYFDNDYPDPRSRLTTTDTRYIATNVEYYDKRDKFIEAVTEGLSEEEAFRTTRRFRDFFEREVRGGRSDLEDLSKAMVSILKSGTALTIKLKGYTSTRGAGYYNMRLSARRIQCVKNEFEDFQYGALKPYLDSGKLKIVDEPLGETTADIKMISDRLDDLVGSIYGIFASLARRVEISAVEVGK